MTEASTEEIEVKFIETLNNLPNWAKGMVLSNIIDNLQELITEIAEINEAFSNIHDLKRSGSFRKARDEFAKIVVLREDIGDSSGAKIAIAQSLECHCMMCITSDEFNKLHLKKRANELAKKALKIYEEFDCVEESARIKELINEIRKNTFGQMI